MTQSVNAWAAQNPKGPFEPFEYTLGPLGALDVDIDVASCGICHSDMSMWHNEWGMSQFPLVPGHEVTGQVRAVGSEVSHLKPGDWVGVGWHAGYCNTCHECLGGDHNLCGSAEGTIVARHGGFADRIRARAPSAVRLPDGIDPMTAGPLLCGGITVFNPLVQMNVKPTDRVGVIGIGGLGHLALQFASAWGCEVVAFSSNADKTAEAKAFGAHHVVNSRDEAALAEWAGQLDFILSTVNVMLAWDQYLACLKPKGQLHVVGAALEPMAVPAFSLIPAQRSVSGSPVGSPVTIATMLEFAARHGIAPKVERFEFDQVNEAIDHLASGQARYRVVLAR